MPNVALLKFMDCVSGFQIRIYLHTHKHFLFNTVLQQIFFPYISVISDLGQPTHHLLPRFNSNGISVEFIWIPLNFPVNIVEWWIYVSKKNDGYANFQWKNLQWQKKLICFKFVIHILREWVALNVIKIINDESKNVWYSSDKHMIKCIVYDSIYFE